MNADFGLDRMTMKAKKLTCFESDVDEECSSSSLLDKSTSWSLDSIDSI